MPAPDARHFPFALSEALAPAWERHRSRLFENARAVSDWLVDQVAPQPGDTVLELAAGPGETGFLAAERIGASGLLISTDVGSGMVAAARRGAEASGLANVECRMMDAQDMDLPDHSLDGIICRFGLMIMPDPGRVFSEARRVLRPKRRLAYAVWGSPDRNPWLTALGAAIHRSGHLAHGDPFDRGGVCSLSEPQQNRDLLVQAGFDEIHVEEIAGTMRFDDLDDYWDLQSQVAGALAVLVSALPAAEVTRVRDLLKSILAAHWTGGAYHLPWAAVAVSAA
ncbi:MAG TPA: methyltransferase domain-containing protein [Acidimicrobiales bacterium]|nr:methyltransferase domain-containing protein [Acidimicrobiales bacterium]